MTRIIATDDGSQYRKAGFLRTGTGILAGTTIQGAVALGGGFLSFLAINKMKSLHEGVDTVSIRSGLNEALQKSGAAANGTKIIDYRNSEPLSRKDFIMNPIAKFYAKKMKPSDIKPGRIINKFTHNEIRLGQNAAFIPKLNKVFINTDKLGLLGFHEIGHSLNTNTSKFWKLMQKIRFPGIIAAVAFGTIAVFKRKKVDGEQPKNIIDKSTDFIKNNVEKLTLLALAPMVAEELKASARGNKMAKQVLSPELAKRVIKANRYGAATYIINTGATVLAAVLGSKVRDGITKPKQVA